MNGIEGYNGIRREGPGQPRGRQDWGTRQDERSRRPHPQTYYPGNRQDPSRSQGGRRPRYEVDPNRRGQGYARDSHRDNAKRTRVMEDGGQAFMGDSRQSPLFSR